MKMYSGGIKIQLYLNNAFLFSFLKTKNDNSIELNGSSIKAEYITVNPAKETLISKNNNLSSENRSQLIAFERSLREGAYKFAFKEEFDIDFFDDSDMTGTYFLHVVYDSRLNIPLMSARSYCTHRDIIAELGGGRKELLLYDHGTGKRKLCGVESILDSRDNVSFLVDRISQQFRNSPKVKRFRGLIYCLLFRSMYIAHKGARNVYSLVRIDDSELLLSRYIQLGLNIIGKTNYKVGNVDRNHWILKGDLIKIKALLPMRIQTLKEIFR